MQKCDNYWRVVYTDPLFDVPGEKLFTQDQKDECHQFVCQLQTDGCKDVRVERLRDDR